VPLEDWDTFAVILLDTHVLVWLGVQPEKLSGAAASAIRRARNCDGLSLADVTIWELALLLSHGVLQARGTVEDTVRNLLDRSGVTVKIITPESNSFSATQFEQRNITAQR
jgi:PIN domain nuclease of toxin-antitoxin system